MDNHPLSEDRPRQDHVDPNGSSRAEHAPFHNTPAEHKAGTSHSRHIIAVCLLGAAIGLSLLWLTKPVPDWLAIPYVLAWAALAGVGYVCLMPRWILSLARRIGLRRARSRGMEVRPLQGSRRWAVVLHVAGVTAIAALTLAMVRVAGHKADSQETIVLGQTSLLADSAAAFRVLVRDHADSRPISGARVRLVLEGNGVRETLGEFKTDEAGSVSDPIHVPAIAPGKYDLVIESDSPIGSDRIVKPIQVRRESRVYVATDKPVYQPGQTIHMRAMALDSTSLKPLAGQTVSFEVLDSRGNKVFKAEPAASQYGIAFCDFALGDEVNLGDYQIHVTVAEATSVRTVEVSRYVLPKFKVEVTTDKPFYLPSETVHGVAKAAYSFGKPVAHAEITVTGRIAGRRPSEVFRTTGTTDADGRFAFDGELFQSLGQADDETSDRANPDLEIGVTVRDGTGHEEHGLERRPVSPESIKIYVLPEAGDFLDDADNLVYLMAAYPNGRPARCNIVANGRPLQCDEMGIAVLTVRPDGRELTLRITARDAAGLTGTRTLALRTWHENNDLLLRTDKAVYRAGETVHATILSQQLSSTFFLDVFNNGQTVLTRTVRPNSQGQTHLALELPSDLTGTLRLNACTGVSSRGDMDFDTTMIHVCPPEGLRMATSPDKSVYRPGDTARVHLQVADCNGAPAPAALSLSAVDEAVFYVCENQPGMLDQFFVTDKRLPLAGYRLAFAISPAELLSGEEKYENLAKALFSPSGQMLGQFAQDTKRHGRDGRVGREAYSLATESYSQKKAKAAAVRNQHFRVPITLLALTAMLMIPLGVFSHSMFRALRQMAGEVRGEDSVQSTRAVGRSIWLLALAVVLPTATFLTSVLLQTLMDRHHYYHYHFRFGIGLFHLSVMTIALPLLAVAGFPAIYRFRTAGFRQIRSGAVKGLALSAAGVALVFTIQYTTTSALMKSSDLFGPHLILSLAAIASPFIIGLALCAVASATSVKEPGKFYAELGRSGYLVLVVLLSLGLVLSIWTPQWHRLWFLDRSSYVPTRGLNVHSTTANLLTDLNNFDSRIEERYMGGTMGGMGGMGGRAPEQTRTVERLAELPRVRRYFPETLLWQPQVITDELGRADIEIPLADSITTWKMNVDAVSAGGKLGNATVDLPVFQDFFVDLDLPVTLTRNDEISIPVLCYNYLDEPQTIRLTAEPSPWCDLLGPASQELSLGAREAGSASFRIRAAQVGTHELAVLAEGSSIGDAVRKSLAVRPDGVEVENVQNGVLARSAEHAFEVPSEAIPHSQKLLLKIYPSAFSEVLEGLESIFRMPHGCFEQTSSATYPNIMALLYMKNTGQATPEIEAQAREYIAAGYQKLLTFELDGGGFDWFGHPPADEKVTAYGILEFSDMAKVHEVDPDVIGRATEWLLSKQNLDGSWGDSDRRGIDDSDRVKTADTAYIAWALAESDIRTHELDRARDFLRNNLHDTDAPYTLALAANALLSQDVNDPFALKLLTALQTRLLAQGFAGSNDRDEMGAMYSRGSCLDVETTALAALAMMKVNPHADTVHKALAWLSEQKDRYGTWRSTQATVLAMKALISGTRRTDAGERPTRIEATVNDQPAGSLAIAPQTRDVLQVLDLTGRLEPGMNRIRLTTDQGIELPYRLVGTYWTPQTTPQVAAADGLDMAIRYDKDHLGVGDSVACRVEVLNKASRPLNMVVVEASLPPGFAVDSSAFDRLVESGVFARYELAADRVVLYARGMAAEERLRFDYRLTPLHPMRVQVRPSSVYEYYQPENKARTEPFELVVQ